MRIYEGGTRDLIECDNVLSYVDIMRDRGVSLTGCKEYRNASAAHLSMFMADLFPVRKKDANAMLMLSDGCI